MNNKNKINKIREYTAQFDSMDIPETIVSVDDITIVIPTLNEEAAIGSVIKDIQMEGYEKIIIIDGHSSDKTAIIAESHGIKVVFQSGEGKTGAIKTAINQVRTPYFVLLDGDNTYAAKDIIKLLPYIQENPEVIGVRSSGRENITIFNRFGNWVINTLFNLVFGTKLTDVCSGMYMLQTHFAKKIILESKGFDVEVEIAANATRHGNIVETPIDFFERLGIQKLHPIRDGAKIIRRIILMGYKLERTRLFYLAELALVFPGIIMTLISHNFNFLNWTLNTYTFGLILLIIGVQGGTLLIVDNRINKLHSKRSLSP